MLLTGLVNGYESGRVTMAGDDTRDGPRTDETFIYSYFIHNRNYPFSSTALIDDRRTVIAQTSDGWQSALTSRLR